MKITLVLLFSVWLMGGCAASPQPLARSVPTSQATPWIAPATPTMTPTAVPPTATRVPSPTLTSVPSPTSTIDPAAPLAGAALTAALQRGGYVIYFRHATTDQTQDDTDTQNLDTCQTQRNLNDQGRTEALAIGKAFRALNIPIGEVLSSAYCRARDTAQLAFGQAQLTTDLTGFPTALREQRIAALRQQLSTSPPAGTNTVLVAHGFNIQNTANLSIAEGEAAIFAPLGSNDFKLVARVRPHEWAVLVQSAGRTLP